MSKLIHIDQEFQGKRVEYLSSSIIKKDLDQDPFKEFFNWLKTAYGADCPEANAFSLATSCNNHVSQRTMLLKAISEEGFIFFTNYQSQKSREVDSNSKVSALFYWPILERQIRITGEVRKTPRKLSEEYFQSRPKGAQIATSVSQQSTKIESREILEKQIEEFSSKMSDQDLICPEYWGGYEILPDRFEFWQGRKNRLHDRIAYENQNQNWINFRLSP